MDTNEITTDMRMTARKIMREAREAGYVALANVMESALFAESFDESTHSYTQEAVVASKSFIQAVYDHREVLTNRLTEVAMEGIAMLASEVQYLRSAGKWYVVNA